MNLNIGQRILVVFVVLLLLLGGTGYYQLNELRDLEEINTTVVSHDIKMLNDIQDIHATQDDMRDCRSLLITERLLSKAGISRPDPSLYEDKYHQNFNIVLEIIRKMVADIDMTAHQARSDERSIALNKMLIKLKKIEDYTKKVRTETDILFKLSLSDINKISEGINTVKVIRDEIDKDIDELRELADGLIAAGNAKTTDSYNHIKLSFLLLFSGLLVISLVLGLALQRSIVPPLRSFMGIVEAIGRGELGGVATVKSNDEVGQLGRNLNLMVAGLREVATQTKAATENLNAATAQIRASTQQQSAGVEEQLAAVQETSATLDEITQSGVQMAKRAKEVANSAEQAVAASHAGLHAAEDATRAMDAIRDQAESVAENIVVLSEKTQAVGEIIITVNDIAERSHLLALNAAIEAASAGEHGRSFAVVAAEIKNLADQAKEATAQVRTILGEIQRGINSSVMLTEEAVKRVAYGKEQTDTTQRTIHDMSDNIQISVQTFQQIVAATNQHQIGLEQTMQALQNIRQASKQTADSTRQLDGAAANLSALGQQLARAVSVYRL
ncbi:MAG: methyl-accepting chemotaxis protein [Rhodospirillaceae bacterium]